MVQEQLQDALRREIRQEVGLELRVNKLLLLDVTEPPYFDLYYECSVVGGSIHSSEEVEELKYFKMAELPSGMSRRHERSLRLIAGNYDDGDSWPLTVPNELILATSNETYYDSPSMHVENTGRSEQPLSAETQLESAVNDYLEQVSKLGIVSEVVFGSQERGDSGRVFNIVADAYSPEHYGDDRYRRLRLLGTELEDRVSEFMPLFVSSVNPSVLPELLQKCKREGFHLARVPVVPEVSIAGDSRTR